MSRDKFIFVCEKPSVAREYKKFLSVKSDKKDGFYEGYSDVLSHDVIITWSYGHLIEICDPPQQDEKWKVWEKDNLPILPNTFKHHVIEDKEGRAKHQFNVLKKLYTRSDIDTIYYAGDSAREGIYIQALIRNQVFGGKDPVGIKEKWVWLNSFSESAVLSGIANAKPFSDYSAMVRAGYARAETDWLIGMNFTRAFSITSGKREKIYVINTGRVLTATLAMIVNRQREIDGYKKTNYYGIRAEQANLSYNWKAVKGSAFFESELLYNPSGFLDKKDAENLLSVLNSDKRLSVEKVEVKRVDELAPLLFNTSDVEQLGSKKFGLKPSETDAALQWLYENSFVSYIRTSSRYLTTVEQQKYKKMGYDIPDHYVNDEDVEDHFAIVPTFSNSNTDSIQGNYKKIYDLILQRFLDTTKPPFVYDKVSVTYIHSSGERFFDTFRNVIDYGWKKDSNEEDSNTNDEDTGSDGSETEEQDFSGREIPKKGDIISVNKFDLRELETKPPVPFTLSTILAAMENAGRYVIDKDYKKILRDTKGIGTAATRAGTIDRLISRGFIEVDKKQRIKPSLLGTEIIQVAEKYDKQLVSPEKTAVLEELLYKLEKADKKSAYEDFNERIKKYVTAVTQRIIKENKKVLQGLPEESPFAGKTFDCPNPECSGTVRHGKHGFYCDAKCGVYLKYVGYDIELDEAQVAELLSHRAIKVKKGGFTYQINPNIKKSVSKDGSKTFLVWDYECLDKFKCPNCGADVIHTKFFSCSKKCGMYFSKAKRTELTSAQIVALLNGKKISKKDENGEPFVVCPTVVKKEFDGKPMAFWEIEQKNSK